MTWLTRITDQLHTTADAHAAAAGWTVTRARWGGRSYRWTSPLPATAAAAGAVVIELDAHRISRTPARLAPSSSTAPTFGGAA